MTRAYNYNTLSGIKTEAERVREEKKNVSGRKELPCFENRFLRCKKCWSDCEKDCGICGRREYFSYFTRAYDWWYGISRCHICRGAINKFWLRDCPKCGKKKNIKCLRCENLVCSCTKGNKRKDLCKNCNKIDCSWNKTPKKTAVRI